MTFLRALLNRNDVASSPVPLPLRCLGEAAGVCLLVVFGPGSAVVSAYHGGALSLEGIAAANGLIIMVLIYALGHISGAHFNPGVTLSFALVRRFPAREIAPYWVAQCLGGLCGAAILLALFGNVLNLGTALPSGAETQAFAMEVLLTFLLMFVIMAVATDSRAAGQTAALAIGATVGLAVLVGGPISGGSMNPARSLGPALVSGELTSLWVYLTAPILGATMGAAFYQLIRGDHSTPGQPGGSDDEADTHSVSLHR